MSETSFVFHVIHANVSNDQVCFPVFPCPRSYTSSQLANLIPLGPLHMPLMQAVNVRSCAKLTVTSTDFNNRILGKATRQGQFSTRTCTGRAEFLRRAYPTPTVYFTTTTKPFGFFFFGGGCVQRSSDSVLCGTSTGSGHETVLFSFLRCLPLH